MNCKKGDLAIAIYSVAGNEGKIFCCLQFVANHPFGTVSHVEYYADAWEVSPSFVGADGRIGIHVPAANLRPIRDSDGQDETLTWAKKPEKVTA